MPEKHHFFFQQVPSQTKLNGFMGPSQKNQTSGYSHTILYGNITSPYKLYGYMGHNINPTSVCATFLKEKKKKKRKKKRGKERKREVMAPKYIYIFLCTTIIILQNSILKNPNPNNTTNNTTV